MFRRILLACLICLLPFQAMAWSSACIDCKHDQAAYDLGHQDQAGETSVGMPDTQSKPDSDHCYLSHAGFQGVPVNIATLPPAAANHSQNAAEMFFRPDSIPHRPDRPKWFAAIQAASTGI